MSCQVLIVDDESDFAALIAEELERVGFATRVEVDGHGGLAFLRTAAPLPALILLDLEMPMMDGYRFRQLQLEDERWREIPVIAMSAASPRSRRPAPGRDFEGWLWKPFDLHALFEVVRSRQRPRSVDGALSSLIAWAGRP